MPHDDFDTQVQCEEMTFGNMTAEEREEYELWLDECELIDRHMELWEPREEEIPF